MGSVPLSQPLKTVRLLASFRVQDTYSEETQDMDGVARVTMDRLPPQDHTILRHFPGH